MTAVVAIDPRAPDGDLLRRAADALRRGALVVYPTDTLYGLGADARDADAVARLAAVKGRPAGRSMPVLIGEIEQLAALVAGLPDVARMLIERFWPGALTLVLPAQPGWEHLASEDGGIGVRLPDHPVPRALSRLLGGPLVGTSANRSGEPAPRDGDGAKAALDDRVELVLDAGELPPSRGSTVLDARGPAPRIVREGDLPAAAVLDALADLGLRDAIARGERCNGPREDETEQEFLRGRVLILQKRRGYRFSLDPVLLAAFARPGPRDRAIDLGTGGGIVPLLLAARPGEGRIVGLEIQEDYADMARRSVDLNGRGGRIEIRTGDLREIRGGFSPESFDLATANPPFRPAGSGRVSPDPAKAAARHETAGTLADFVAAARYLLRQNGRACFVYPAARLVDLLAGLREARLEPRRLRTIQPDAAAPANLALVEAVKGGKPGMAVERPLVVLESPGRYTVEVEAILEAGSCLP